MARGKDEDWFRGLSFWGTSFACSWQTPTTAQHTQCRWWFVRCGGVLLLGSFGIFGGGRKGGCDIALPMLPAWDEASSVVAMTRPRGVRQFLRVNHPRWKRTLGHSGSEPGRGHPPDGQGFEPRSCRVVWLPGRGFILRRRDDRKLALPKLIRTASGSCGSTSYHIWSTWHGHFMAFSCSQCVFGFKAMTSLVRMECMGGRGT